MKIYFDENFPPALVKGLREFQKGAGGREGIEVLLIKEEFGSGTADEVWIPEVAKRHGVVITQDTNIHRLNAQWDLCETNKLGLFFFQPPKKGWHYWKIVETVVVQWAKIKDLSREQSPPFGYRYTASSPRFKKL